MDENQFTGNPGGDVNQPMDNQYGQQPGYDAGQYAPNGQQGYDNNQYMQGGQQGYDNNQYMQGGQQGYDNNQYMQGGQPGYGNNPYMQGGQQPNNPYFQQPANSGGGKKVKQPMSKGKKIGIISGCVAGVAAIVLGILFIPKLFKSPRDKVEDAFRATFSAEYMSEVSPYDDIFGMEDLQKAIEKNGLEMETKIEINSVQGDTSLSGLGMNYSAASDATGDNMSGEFTLFGGGSDLLGVQFIKNSDSLYFTSPGLMNGYLEGTAEEWVATLESIMESLSGSYYGSSSAISSTDSVDTEALSKEMQKISDKLWTDAEIKKDGKETLALGSNTRKCTKYNVVFSEESIEDALASVMDVYVDMLAQQGADSYTISVFQQVKSMIPSIVPGDFTMAVYIYDGKVACISSKDRITLYGVSFDYDVYLKFTGDDNLHSAFEARAALSVSGTEVYVEVAGGSKKVSGGVETTLDASIGSDGIAYVTLDYDQKYYSSDNSFEISGTLDADGEKIAISGKGAFVDIVKGSSFGIQLDNLSVSYNGADIMSFDVAYSMGELKNSLATVDPSKTVVNIANCTSDDLANLIDTNSDVYNQLMLLFGQFGSGGYYEDDGWYDDYDWEDDWSDDDWEDDWSDDDWGSSGGSLTWEADTDYENTPLTCSDGSSVAIKGAVPGFSCTYSSQYVISFSNDVGTDITYEIKSYDTLEEVLSSEENFVTSLASYGEGIYNVPLNSLENNLTANVDGTDITYLKASVYDDGLVYYAICRTLPNGEILLAEVEIYVPESETMTEDEILRCISDTYISYQ